MDDKIPPIHPGEILMEEFLVPMGVTQNRLAVSIGVPPRRINEIVHGKRRITADTALRLGRFYSMSAQFWINLQVRDVNGALVFEATTGSLTDNLEAVYLDAVQRGVA